GLLRPGQRLLPRVGPPVARRGSHAGLAGRVGPRGARPGGVPAQAGPGAPGRPAAAARAGRDGRLRDLRVSGSSPAEMMIVAAARALAGARTVFVGVGLPNLCCNLARLTVAPDLELIYESGIYGARPERLPLSIGDPTLVTGATAVIPMSDLFGLYLQG